jgi:hypothetical protein
VVVAAAAPLGDRTVYRLDADATSAERARRRTERAGGKGGVAR